MVITVILSVQFENLGSVQLGLEPIRVVQRVCVEEK